MNSLEFSGPFFQISDCLYRVEQFLFYFLNPLNLNVPSLQYPKKNYEVTVQNVLYIVAANVHIYYYQIILT